MLSNLFTIFLYLKGLKVQNLVYVLHRYLLYNLLFCFIN